MSWSHGSGRSLVLFVAVGVAAGCGGSGGGPTEAQPEDPVFTALTLTASATTLFTRPPGTTVVVIARAVDQSGRVMSGLGTPEYTSDNPAVATVDAAGLVSAVGTGSTAIRASLTAGGVTRSAHIDMLVTEGDLAATVSAPQFSFDPASVDVARGGTVTWTLGPVPHNVTFASGAGPQDIPTWSDGSNSRAFPESGTFSYQCTVHSGMSGMVVVH
jgi:plastocyanin